MRESVSACLGAIPCSLLVLLKGKFVCLVFYLVLDIKYALKINSSCQLMIFFNIEKYLTIFIFMVLYFLSHKKSLSQDHEEMFLNFL